VNSAPPAAPNLRASSAQSRSDPVRRIVPRRLESNHAPTIARHMPAFSPFVDVAPSLAQRLLIMFAYHI